LYIEKNTFRNNAYITSIKFNEGFASFYPNSNNCSFMGMTALQTISFPSSLKNPGNNYLFSTAAAGGCPKYMYINDDTTVYNPGIFYSSG
jgi:hypothetical protein